VMRSKMSAVPCADAAVTKPDIKITKAGMDRTPVIQPP
jgi:hypothetical protein